MSPRFSIRTKGRSRKNSLRVMFGIAPFLFASRASGQGTQQRSASTQATVTIMPSNGVHVIPSDTASKTRVMCDENGNAADHERRCTVAVTRSTPPDSTSNRVTRIELVLP
jgi:hypothetical protein